MLALLAARRTALPFAAAAVGAGTAALAYNHTASGAGRPWRAAESALAQGTLHPLDALWQTVESRRGADPKSSWTAKLLSSGVEKCSQKVGEEATECVIEAIKGDHIGLIKESADLLYHLNVLWAAAGVSPSEVYSELERREGKGGIAEKASRPKQ